MVHVFLDPQTPCFFTSSVLLFWCSTSTKYAAKKPRYSLRVRTPGMRVEPVFLLEYDMDLPTPRAKTINASHVTVGLSGPIQMDASSVDQNQARAESRTCMLRNLYEQHMFRWLDLYCLYRSCTTRNG